VKLSKTKNVTFRGLDFWAYDFLANIFLKYLIDAATEYAVTHDETWINQEIESWRISAVVSDQGLFLNDDWDNRQIEVIVELIEKACESIATRTLIHGSEIRKWDILDGMTSETRGYETVPTFCLIRIGRAMSNMLLNNFEKSPLGTWWFFGIEEKLETLEMS
jgi:hypothetical protein